MAAWLETCNASIVPKTAEQYTQLTFTEFDTFRRSVEPVDGRLILLKYRRRFNVGRRMYV